MAKVKFDWIGGQALISNIKDGKNTGDNYAGYSIPNMDDMKHFKVGKKINVIVSTGETAYGGEQEIIQIGNDSGSRLNMIVTDKVKLKFGDPATKDLGSASGEIEVKPNLLLPIGIGVGLAGLITAMVIVVKKRAKKG
jgi:hypothetical protein